MLPREHSSYQHPPDSNSTVGKTWHICCGRKAWCKLANFKRRDSISEVEGGCQEWQPWSWNVGSPHKASRTMPMQIVSSSSRRRAKSLRRRNGPLRRTKRRGGEIKVDIDTKKQSRTGDHNKTVTCDGHMSPSLRLEMKGGGRGGQACVKGGAENGHVLEFFGQTTDLVFAKLC